MEVLSDLTLSALLVGSDDRTTEALPETVSAASLARGASRAGVGVSGEALVVSGIGLADLESGVTTSTGLFVSGAQVISLPAGHTGKNLGVARGRVLARGDLGHVSSSLVSQQGGTLDADRVGGSSGLLVDSPSFEAFLVLDVEVMKLLVVVALLGSGEQSAAELTNLLLRVEVVSVRAFSAGSEELAILLGGGALGTSNIDV